MYLSTVKSGTATGAPPTDKRPGLRGRFAAVSANVFALGAVSLVTDISSEMVTAVLPLYLVLGLQLSPLAYGAIDGVYTGATALLRLAGGYLADRMHRRKLVAGIGYGMSAVAKLGLLAAGRATGAIGLVIAADRAGKGLRTAPRDALITLSTPPHALGRAFGVHRTMDSIGAFLGPLVALGVLAAAAQSYDAVFVTSFCVAAIGVLLLALFVRDHRGTLPAKPGASPVRLRDAATLLAEAPVRRLVLAACLLGLATIGDGFLYLMLQRREEVSTVWFPLLAAGTSLGYLLVATPMGILADRVGRLPVLLGGYTALAVTYLLVFGPFGGWPLLVLTLGLYGVFYAATDGVLMALAGPVLPERLRTTGIALIQTGQALSYLVSSVLFGLAWTLWGPQAASRVAAAAVLVAIAVTVALLRTRATTRPAVPTQPTE
ncbi:MFS transporter [Catellatospora tritici]|uniref:MFS transporter n=1 Tax=Catellatospora tritici TaxID=2851566 RepID=UPI0027E18A15|nr:MFS transporter [Catellatospora tritici]